MIINRRRVIQQAIEEAKGLVSQQRKIYIKTMEHEIETLRLSLEMVKIRLEGYKNVEAVLGPKEHDDNRDAG